MVIREKTQADHESILSVVRDLHGVWFSTRGVEQIALDQTFQQGFVAEEDGRVVGFLLWFVYEGVGNIAWMGVLRGRHRAGIGRRLVGELETLMKSRGVTTLQVYTLGNSVNYEAYERTRAFYRAMGFTEFKREKHPDNPECPESLYLRKVL